MHLKFVLKTSHFGTHLGKIGPYFINTHYLYGSEKEAKEFLEFIDSELENSDKLDIPKNLFEKSFKQYNTNETYHLVIDELKKLIEQNVNLNEVDYISGGERRDWFFSNILAYLLNKPHITIYKNMLTVTSSSNFEESELYSSLEGKKVLHIADLVTEASSYLRAWIPAIEKLGAKMCWSFVVIDRMQGGSKKLEERNVLPYSLFKIDNTLFTEALKLNVINEEQLKMLQTFTENPDESMKAFLINHPEFLQDSLNSDEKTAKRAKLCIDNNLYNL